VDDRKENRDVLGQMLTSVRLRSVLCRQRGEALRAVQEKPPQVVFLDLLLPDMNGIAAAQALLSGPCGIG